jgi:hypothetical protein
MHFVLLLLCFSIIFIVLWAFLLSIHAPTFVLPLASVVILFIILAVRDRRYYRDYVAARVAALMKRYVTIERFTYLLARVRGLVGPNYYAERSLHQYLELWIREKKPEGYEKVRQAIENLPEGEVIIRPASVLRMTRHQTCRISATITVPQGKLAHVVGERTKVGDSMSVTLVAPEDEFTIQPFGQADRLFGGNETWEFNVTANKAGTFLLSLMVAVLLQLEGQANERPYYGHVRTIEIRVSVDWLPTIGRLVRAWSYTIAGAIGTAVLGYIVQLEPLKTELVKDFNKNIGVHIGIKLPEKDSSSSIE